MKNSALIVSNSLERAERFRKRHEADARVNPTYGYFTRHPVAPLNRKRLTLLLQLISGWQREQGGRPLRVLDLACGGGLIACAVSALGTRVLGLDLSPEEIALARKFALEENFSATFDTANLLSDPSWERKVEEKLEGKPDVVLLAYALHHLPEVERFADRLGGWLEPGARLLINEENPASLLFRLKHFVRGLIQKDTDVEWRQDYAAWSAMFATRGFGVGAAQGVDLLPLMGRVMPTKCWSLVFTARKLPILR